LSVQDSLMQGNGKSTAKASADLEGFSDPHRELLRVALVFRPARLACVNGGRSAALSTNAARKAEAEAAALKCGSTRATANAKAAALKCGATFKP
jgi:hypothetical protein